MRKNFKNWSFFFENKNAKLLLLPEETLLSSIKQFKKSFVNGLYIKYLFNIDLKKNKIYMFYVKKKKTNLSSNWNIFNKVSQLFSFKHKTLIISNAGKRYF